MKHFLLIVSVTTLTLLCQTTAHGSEAGNGPVLGVEKAMTLPISDGHFHAMGKFMKPETVQLFRTMT